MGVRPKELPTTEVQQHLILKQHTGETRRKWKNCTGSVRPTELHLKLKQHTSETGRKWKGHQLLVEAMAPLRI
jgi:hypothetical protein